MRIHLVALILSLLASDLTAAPPVKKAPAKPAAVVRVSPPAPASTPTTPPQVIVVTPPAAPTIVPVPAPSAAASTVTTPSAYSKTVQEIKETIQLIAYAILLAALKFLWAWLKTNTKIKELKQAEEIEQRVDSLTLRAAREGAEFLAGTKYADQVATSGATAVNEVAKRLQRMPLPIEVKNPDKLHDLARRGLNLLKETLADVKGHSVTDLAKTKSNEELPSQQPLPGALRG